MTSELSVTEAIQIAAQAADAKGGSELIALDVSQPLPFVDAFLIVTGRNERNVIAIAGEVEDKLNEAGVKTKRREGRAGGRWVLLDFGSVVVHVFHDEERSYYDLERLWKDCPQIEITLPEPVSITQ
ncbi:ribosome silencing factor [Mycetocola lacteus]|uniref:Ribosomal silencing factor RsfS n=1 Tax=Mycetocola lacteus TaxID=76637 RepID=A0A3L7APC2_9MICO|nr:MULTISPECIES: ribosome silencing factor [Mycetocola]MCS4275955.1 ribosome-associated protein [Mycetocola sp. BIGb0189]RLP82276.1 ribosome silencing factor [Mycetocola lacteus]